MKLMTEADKEKRRAYQRAWNAKRKAKSTGQFQCEKCDAAFTTKHGLNLHVLRTHSSKAKNWNKNVRNSNKARGNGTTNQPSGVLFCPKCGCNIKAVSVAMDMI